MRHDDDDDVPIRPEVLAARRERGVSTILQAPPLKRAAAYAGATLLVLSLFLVFATHTSKFHVSGQLQPIAGITQVVVPQGRIADLYVRVGDPVQMHQILARLSSDQVGSDDSIDALLKDLKERRSERAKLRDLTIVQLTERGAALATQERMVEAEIATRGIAIAGEQINVAAAMRTLDQLRRDSAAINGQIKLARSESSQALAVLDQQIAEHDGRRAMNVITFAAGTITALAFKQGQTVPAGAALADILPDGSTMEAVLLVPSRALPHIKPYQPVWLRIDAFPYQKVGQQRGVVVQVDRSPISNAAPGAEQLYRVRVMLVKQTVFMDGKEQPITAGMGLQTTILGDRRRLIEWLFQPMIGAAKGRAP
jgi:membrane fusion protein